MFGSRVRKILVSLVVVTATPATLRATETASVYDNDGLTGIELQSWGGEEAAGWELFRSLELDSTRVEKLTTVDGSTVLLYKRLRSEKPSITQYWTKLTLQDQTPEQLDALRAEIKTGRIHLTGKTAGDIAEMLKGDDDSDATTHRITGKFIRCGYPLPTSGQPQGRAVCELSLSAPLERPQPPKACEFFVDKVAHLVNGPNWGDGEEVIAVLKVRSELQDQVLSLQFRPDGSPYSSRLSPVQGLKGFYRIDFATVLNPHGGVAFPESAKGTFVLKLKDGRVFQFGAGPGKGFQIDSDLARRVSTVKRESLSDAEVPALPSTATSSTQDAVARYLNPNGCR